MARQLKPGGFKNFLSEGAKDKKKKELAVLRQKAQETGSFLDAPMTKPDTQSQSHGDLRAAQCTVQGWRRHNEDAASIVLSLPRHPEACFLGVYDGHGGSAVAECISKRLHGIVDARLPDALEDREGVCGALRRAFVEMDDVCHSELREDQCSSTGATCNVVLLTKSHIVCGNAGDARSILIMGDGSTVPLSEDHAPDSPGERERIERAGSHLTADGRIDGMLNVSRAMGDFDFKRTRTEKPPEEQAVTCAADVTVQERTGAERVVVQACDGIWGAKSTDEVGRFVAERLDAGESPGAAAEALCAACLAPALGDDSAGTDNMSVNILVMAK